MGAMKHAFWLMVALPLTSCSVADNLTYGELALELDGIVAVRGSGADRTIEYADRAEVSVWYMRWPIFVPIRQALGWMLGRTSPRDLDNPSHHVRTLLRELPDEAGGDLGRCSDTVARMLWVVELDPSPGNRIVALDAMCRVLGSLGIRGFDGRREDIAMVTEAPRLENARLAVRTGRPAGRQAAAWGDPQREVYRAAVATLVEHPLEQWFDRIGLLGDLVQLWQEETDPALRESLGIALRRAIGHGVRGALIRSVQGRAPRYSDVRLCAMQQLRRLGGPAAVPLLLAVMASPAAGTTGISSRFDQDPLVQLRLIHLCGQLRGEEAERALRLAGREEWDALAPIDFLAQTVLAERAYYSKLRVPALTALGLCIGRERLDYEVSWVEEWYRNRQRGS